jgi:ceramide glucosyltransferase
VNFANAILATFAWLSLALAFWQWLAARRFSLHRRITDLSFSPAITLLKPLKGCDATTAESLQSWFRQDYTGQTQILFGVADANDPVCKVVRELIEKNPGHDAQLVVCAESPGANAKVSKLIQLEKVARHELVLVSDADVRVPPDLLANAAAPLRDPKTGLVNCFYRLANPATLAMRWEAIAINADFWSQVLQAASLKPLDFALGAVMLVRREALAEIGGFSALADCLADDYQLGHRLAKNGHHIALCPVVVECWDTPMHWREVWQHQLRWARTIRVCQPLPYFFSILSNATFWPLLWLVGALASGKNLCVLLIACACLLIRICLAQNLQRRLVQSRDHLAPPWLVPVKDLLQVALWIGAFTGSAVEWRGRRMKLCRDGTLVEVT